MFDLRNQLIPFLFTAVSILLFLGCGGQPEEPSPQPTTTVSAVPPTPESAPKREIYHPEQDAAAEIKQSLIKAKKDNRHVILVWGGNWCGWCYKLHDLFENNEPVSELLEEDFIVIPVDYNSNKSLGAQYSESITSFPFLTVLEASGEVLINQRTEPLEEGDHHSPVAVLKFLEEWKPKPQEANTVFHDSIVQASRENKLVFLHLGSPSCGYCRLLDAFLWRKDIAPLMEQDYVEVKIDLARMEGAQEFAQQIRPGGSGGIPWFAVLDGKGAILATSDGPNGNVGYPVAQEEIAHFMKVIGETSKNLNPDQLAIIENSLVEGAEKLKARRASAQG
ncbi:MAG: thioredoxin family protein [Candidatus Omnitrophica bacterium]|nr:thioredoxin family protein [Candidatus Omnitrophota bacterium]